MRVDTTNPTYYQQIDIWKNVSFEDWNDPVWQMKNSVRTVEQLEKVIPLTDEEKREIEKTLSESKFRVTPYYLSLIDQDNPKCPIKMQCIPTEKELYKSPSDVYDPLAEDSDSPVHQLVHRYPDRALFLVSEFCSSYCRFCTRRRKVLDKTSKQLKKEHDIGLKYLKKHPEIRDVILSGGDALLLDLSELERLLVELRNIPHIEIVRIASRTPCVFPQRITDEVVQIINKYQPVYFMTHFNHPYELTSRAMEACAKIVDAGIPMMNQTVLLRGINSSPYIMKKLMHKLLQARVKPYYIYQCDLTVGIEHFRTPVGNGLKIMEYLRGHTSGIALPTLVVDAPGGGGKVPIMPNYLLTWTEERVVIRNYRGMMSAYTNPENTDCTCSTENDIKKGLNEAVEMGLAYFDLVEGKELTLDPGVKRR
jgi:lysine 2,3-aminomutase